MGLIRGQVDDIMNSFARPVQGVYAVSEGNGYIYCEVCTGLPSCSLHLCVHRYCHLTDHERSYKLSSDICMQVARNILLTRFTRFNAAGVGG